MIALLLGLAFGAPVDELDAVLPDARAEIPLDRTLRYATPVPAVHSDGSEWVLLVTAQLETLEVSWYDASLQPVDATLVDLPRGAVLRDWYQDGDAVFVAFTGGGRRDVWMVELPVKPGPIGVQAFTAPKAFAPTELVVDGDDIYLYGSFAVRTAVLHGRAGSPGWLDPLLLDGLPRRVELSRMATSPLGGVDLVVTEQKRSRTSWVANAKDGELSLVQEVRRDKHEPVLRDAQRLEEDDGRLVIGTYAQPGARGTDGLYVGRYTADGRQWLRTHPFIEMEGFFDFLPGRRAERASRRAERRAARGRTELDYLFLLHDLREVGDDVLVVAEAYSPVYRTETRTETTMVNGRAVTRTVTTQVFVGWQLALGLAAAVDRGGELVWTHSLEAGGLYTTLDERIAVTVDGEDVGLTYTRGPRLASLRIVDGERVAEADEKRMTGGEILAAWQTSAEPWGRGFLLWGIQRVADEGGRRRVFFLSRLDPERRDAGEPAP
ncbi:MAG: hypothetical protein EP330_21580 [Deltaproteobacteria bacterium]|nr:MAG: hypothetical protein EP330_21580 [Deltaproteobacteria bacterium]